MNNFASPKFEQIIETNIGQTLLTFKGKKEVFPLFKVLVAVV